MRLTIHRETQQIGGSCVELQAGADRVLLDLGLPLPQPGEKPAPLPADIPALLQAGVLPPIVGVYANDSPGVRAVVMSHVYADHLGLAPYVHPAIPVYATAGTWALRRSSEVFMRPGPVVANPQTLSCEQPLRCGELTVTAYPVDHSAPAAVALLVAAAGKRVLYSGDLRAHGRKGVLLDRLIRALAGRVDLLLLEGTTLGRSARGPLTERGLENRLVSLLAGHDYLTTIFCSGQKLDRLVSIFRATKRPDKTLVMDLYVASTQHLLQCISSHLPQWDWDGIRVVPWGYQQQRLEQAGEGAFTAATRRQWIGWEEMQRRADEVVLLLRGNFKVGELERRLGPSLSRLQVIWSQWQDFWPDDRYVRPLCERHGLQPIFLHSSGHAARPDLQRLVAGLRPGQLVPIHTEHPEVFAQIFPAVLRVADGETVNV